jgi:hypothetical protein
VSNARPQSDDTTLAAEQQQFAVWRAMTPAQKFAAFLELQQTAIALSEAGIRRRYPMASDREVFLRRIAQTLPREDMVRWYGWDPDEADREIGN